jgi:hypothetical protein
MLELWNELFTCDPKKGHLYWNGTIPRGPKKGTRAGGVRQKAWGPRRVVRYKDINWYEHRIIWTMTNGEIPDDMVIDHINGNALDNRISNLRVVTPSINSRNRKVGKNNTSGKTGVYYYKPKEKWRAHIFTGNTKHALVLGTFDTKEEAIAARKGAEKILGYRSR